MEEKPKHISEQDIDRMKDSGDVGGLIEALNYGGDWVVRKFAAIFLGEMGDRRAVEPLLKVLRNESSGIRSEAASALGRLGDSRAFEPLLQALKDTKWRMRKSAAFALGKLGDMRAVEPLLEALEDGYWEVRCKAAEALGKLDDRRAVEHLVPLLREKDPGDENGEVLRAAAEALDKLGWAPGNDLDRVYYLMAKGEWEKLAEIGEVAVEPLLEALHYGWNYGLRVGAAKILGMIGDARAVEPLVEILRDENWESGFRCRVAEALAEIGDARAVEPLRQTLVKDEYFVFAVRSCAAAALDKLGWKPKNNVEKAYYLITNEEWEKVVNMGAAAVNPLIKALWNEDEVDEDRQNYIRKNAAQALGMIGSARAVDPLFEFLGREHNREVYNAAKEALKRLGREWKDEEY